MDLSTGSRGNSEAQPTQSPPPRKCEQKRSCFSAPYLLHIVARADVSFAFSLYSPFYCVLAWGFFFPSLRRAFTFCCVRGGAPSALVLALRASDERATGDRGGRERRSSELPMTDAHYCIRRTSLAAMMSIPRFPFVGTKTRPGA